MVWQCVVLVHLIGTLQWLKMNFFFESVGGGNEFAPNLSTILFRKLSNVKSVHQQCNNDL